MSALRNSLRRPGKHGQDTHVPIPVGSLSPSMAQDGPAALPEPRTCCNASPEILSTFADSADSATFTTVWGVRCKRQSRHGRRRLLRTAEQGARRAEGRRPSAAWMAAAEPFTLGTGARDGFTACLCPSARRAPGFAEHISRGPSTLWVPRAPACSKMPRN
jgi:hypothetical protein